MKITIVGAGNVGVTVAQIIAEKELANEAVLVDIKPGLAEGKAFDIMQAGPITNSDTRVIGVTDDYAFSAGSEIVVITSGIPRKRGMSRDELISINAKIVKSVTEKVVKYSPDAKIIIVSNPLDIMTYTAYLAARSDPSKVFGMAGILDTARFRTFLAEALNCNPKDIQALLLGGHGDTMVPLLRYTTISGIPVTQLLEKEKLNNIIKKTKNGGGDMINLLGTSAWYAPAVATAQMVEAIVHDQKHIVPCCAMLNGEYGMKNIYIGVPVKLGKDGIEQIIEIELNKEERALFETSAKAVKSAMVELDNMKLFEQYTSFENPISQESIVCG